MTEKPACLRSQPDQASGVAAGAGEAGEAGAGVTDVAGAAWFTDVGLAAAFAFTGAFFTISFGAGAFTTAAGVAVLAAGTAGVVFTDFCAFLAGFAAAIFAVFFAGALVTFLPVAGSSAVTLVFTFALVFGCFFNVFLTVDAPDSVSAAPGAVWPMALSRCVRDWRRRLSCDSRWVISDSMADFAALSVDMDAPYLICY